MADNTERISIDGSNLLSETSFDSPTTFGISATHMLQEEVDLQNFLTSGGSPSTIDEVTPIEEDVPLKDEPKEKATKRQLKQPVEDNDDSLDNYLSEDEDNNEEDKSFTKPSKKTVQEDTEDTDETVESPFAILSQDLMELGVFSQEENEAPITNAEEFLAKFNQEIESRTADYLYNNVLSRFGQEGVDMFESIFINGVPPQHYLNQFTQLQSVKDLDLAEESNQEYVVREYYKRAGWPDEKVNAKVKKLKDLYDLQEEAEMVHERLVETEEKALEQTKQTAVARQRQIEQGRQQYANNLSTILNDKLRTKEFDGIPVTPKVAENAFDFLYTEKYQLPNGERLSEFDKYILELRKPENHEKKVKLALLALNDLDLTKVKTAAVSKESSEMFNRLARQQKVAKRSNQIPPTNSFLSNL